MKRSAFFLTLAFTLCLSGNVLASKEMSPYEKLRSLLSEVKNSCQGDACTNGLSLQKAYLAPYNTLTQDVLRALQEKAFDLAQIWGDTILEGDYAADGETQLERVDILSRDGKVLAYRIRYSEGGWNTGQCVYSEPMVLENCQSGRILESAWTLDNFEADYSEDDQLVVFIPTER